MKKRIMSVIVLLALCISSAACGDKQTVSQNETDEQTVITGDNTESAAEETEAGRGYPAPDTEGIDFNGEEMRFRAL